MTDRFSEIGYPSKVDEQSAETQASDLLRQETSQSSSPFKPAAIGQAIKDSSYEEADDEYPGVEMNLDGLWFEF
ncbi:MAG: hypothetical protein K2X77_02430 [Candidatus Obscuribacterales bacterium]|jgi:hypothetical protein|nr:hypothetical protein [Candidatus Obscuribacterales bacterium]